MDGLVRVVRLEGGILALSSASRGRGAWLCRDSPECVDRAERRRALERALRGPIAEGQPDAIGAAVRALCAEGREPGSESPVP